MSLHLGKFYFLKIILLISVILCMELVTSASISDNSSSIGHKYPHKLSRDKSYPIKIKRRKRNKNQNPFKLDKNSALTKNFHASQLISVGLEGMNGNVQNLVRYQNSPTLTNQKGFNNVIKLGPDAEYNAEAVQFKSRVGFPNFEKKKINTTTKTDKRHPKKNSINDNKLLESSSVDKTTKPKESSFSNQKNASLTRVHYFYPPEQSNLYPNETGNVAGLIIVQQIPSESSSQLISSSSTQNNYKPEIYLNDHLNLNHIPIHHNNQHEPNNPNSFRNHDHHTTHSAETSENSSEKEDAEFQEGRITIAKVLLGSKYLKKGTSIVILAVLMSTLIIGGLTGVTGASLSPILFPLILLPIAIIAFILFIPSIILFIPIVIAGLAGGQEKRRNGINETLLDQIFGVREIQNEVDALLKNIGLDSIKYG